MKNKTANALSIISWTIWVLGSIGSLIVFSNINKVFEFTAFSSVSTSILIVSLFNTFCTGMTFYGLATIIEMIDSKSSALIQDSPKKKENLVGASESDDVLKF